MFTAGTGPGQGWGQRQHRAVPVLHSLQKRSLQPQHSRDGDKGLSLHAWLVGRNRTKLRPQLILLLGQRTGRSMGRELAALGYTHRPFLQCSREDSLTDLPLCAPSSKSAVCRAKLGLPREDGEETLLPPCQKRKGLFFSQGSCTKSSCRAWAHHSSTDCPTLGPGLQQGLQGTTHPAGPWKKLVRPAFSN